METVAALTAAIGFVDTEEGRAYKAWLIPEDGLTDGDERLYVGPIGWRPGRLSLTWSDVEGDPHGEARHVGNLDNLRREMRDGESWVVADVSWDGDDLAVEAKRLVDEDKMRGVSVHPTEAEGYLVCGVPSNPTADSILALAEEFDMESCERPIAAFINVVIGAATILMLPAFEDAEVVVAADIPIASDGLEIQPFVLTDTAVTMSYNGITFTPQVESDGKPWSITASDLKRPPAEWFTDPGLDQPQALTIDDEGRVKGHLALWSTCHRGFDNTCITPPKDSTNYAEFHDNARVMLDSGELIGVGCLTVDVSHADVRSSAEAAKKHYDHSGAVVAQVRAGQDEHGVWVAGAVAPWATSEQIEKLRRLSLSGDWRPKNGSYFLIAAQAVPVPGFPIRARVASGEQVSLTTIGPANPLPDPLEAESDLALVASALAVLAESVSFLRERFESEDRQREYEKALAILNP